MERVTLNASKRERKGKGAARSLRREGFIPSIIYRGGSSTSVQLEAKELSRFINKTAGAQVIVNLQLSDGIKQAIVKDYQVDPVTGRLLHVDFQEFAATDVVRVMVHVNIKGEAIGVKRDKGILQNVTREIEIECMPDKIPGHIDVDVSNLTIGQSIHVRDLNMGEGIRVLNDADEVIVGVVAIKEKTAASDAAAAEAAEPEVIKKGKKEATKE